jgi:starch-binding outer membrane protein, SusD/RagB family
MKTIYRTLKISAVATVMLFVSSCDGLINEPLEKDVLTDKIDYTQTQNMVLHLYGVYAEFQSRGWEDFPIISVRGDDVNAGGLGDQQEFTDEDNFIYANKSYWMFNSVWQNLYTDIFKAHSAMEHIEKFKEYAPNPAVADQYIAEIKVMEAFLLFQLSRVWGAVIIVQDSDPSNVGQWPLSSKDEVMQYISNRMDEAIPALPNVHPVERTDIKGGITRFTALAVKALANLELKNYQQVADATGQIINSGEFELRDDYYNLFKIPGKLDRENILELQYSDFGQGSGTNMSYLFAFFGPENWTPEVVGAGSGWGFFEPSKKYIKFMIDRGDEKRLETSVIFTDRGITALENEGVDLPSWVSNETPSGDIFKDYNRAMFASGKHYLPSDQLTPGRTDYGTNKNFICIRYAEILLMYAEALEQGATGSAGTSAAAVNLIRTRADLPTLTEGEVDLDVVMDEKYAELAMEWGTRYYDMVRLGRYDELSYDGRTFSPSKIFLPYPQDQVDKTPILKNE